MLKKPSKYFHGKKINETRKKEKSKLEGWQFVDEKFTLGTNNINYQWRRNNEFGKGEIKT